MRYLRDLLKSQSIAKWCQISGSIAKLGVQKYDINCLLEQYYEGVLCKCNMPLIF